MIINEIEKLAQSDKKVNLLNNPMTITITTISKPSGGAGRPKHQQGYYGFNKDSLLLFSNTDNNYCLFIAVELARIRNNSLEASKNKNRSQVKTSTTDSTYQLFREIRKSSKRQQNIAEELMRSCKIPLDLPSYDITHLETVQNYYNNIYGHRYQISVFNDDPFTSKNIRPVWKGKCEGISHNEEIKNLFLFLENNHFSTITCISSFFRVPRKKYCIGTFIYYYSFYIYISFL
jgi:hypothetical protein